MNLPYDYDPLDDPMDDWTLCFPDIAPPARGSSNRTRSGVPVPTELAGSPRRSVDEPHRLRQAAMTSHASSYGFEPQSTDAQSFVPDEALQEHADLRSTARKLVVTELLFPGDPGWNSHPTAQSENDLVPPSCRKRYGARGYVPATGRQAQQEAKNFDSHGQNSRHTGHSEQDYHPFYLNRKRTGRTYGYSSERRHETHDEIGKCQLTTSDQTMQREDRAGDHASYTLSVGDRKASTEAHRRAGPATTTPSGTLPSYTRPSETRHIPSDKNSGQTTGSRNSSIKTQKQSLARPCPEPKGQTSSQSRDEGREHVGDARSRRGRKPSRSGRRILKYDNNPYFEGNQTLTQAAGEREYYNDGECKDLRRNTDFPPPPALKRTSRRRMQWNLGSKMHSKETLLHKIPELTVEKPNWSCPSSDEEEEENSDGGVMI